MRIWHWTPEAGHPIAAFGSRGVTLSPVLRAETLHIVAMYLEPGGIIGRHPAAGTQLLLVTGGSGTVTGDDPTPGVPAEPGVPVEAGSAVVWRRGEEHETHAGPGGLHAIVIEGPALDELYP